MSTSFHYHAGHLLPGSTPAGEVGTYRTLAEAIDASQANMADLVAGFRGQDVAIKYDMDDDVVPGTSAWVTVEDGKPGEFSYYCWVGKADDAAGESCDCDDGEFDLAGDESSRHEPFSPGRWDAAYGELMYGHTITVYAADGEGDDVTLRAVAVTCDGEADDSVMYHESPGGDHEGIAECVANAELIRRAPAMYRLLSRLVDTQGEPETSSDVLEAAATLVAGLRAEWGQS